MTHFNYFYGISSANVCLLSPFLWLFIVSHIFVICVVFHARTHTLRIVRWFCRVILPLHLSLYPKNMFRHMKRKKEDKMSNVAQFMHPFVFFNLEFHVIVNAVRIQRRSKHFSKMTK